jgi:hypothetical protein
VLPRSLPSLLARAASISNKSTTPNSTFTHKSSEETSRDDRLPGRTSSVQQSAAAPLSSSKIERHINAFHEAWLQNFNTALMNRYLSSRLNNQNLKYLKLLQSRPPTSISNMAAPSAIGPKRVIIVGAGMSFWHQVFLNPSWTF